MAGIVLADSKPSTTSGIKIGGILPLSGDNAFWGQSALNGMRLAVEDVNLSGGIGGRMFELLIEDDRCEPKAAVSAFYKLTGLEGLKFILGPVASSATLAVAPLAEREKILLIAPCSESGEISRAGDYIFRTWTPNGRQGSTMAKYLYAEMKVRRAAILSRSDDYGQSLGRAFVQAFTEAGGEIVMHEEYRPDETDFRSYMTKVQSRTPDILYIVSYIADGVALVRQARAMGMTLRLAGGSNFNSPDVVNQLGRLGDGIVFSDLRDSTTPEFKSRYESTYRVPWPGIGSCARVAYDDVMLLAEGMRRTEGTPTAVKDFLYSLRDYPGMSGPITFDSNGDLTRQYIIYEIRDGQAHPLRD